MSVVNELMIQPQSIGEMYIAGRDIAGPTSYTTGGVKTSPNTFSLLAGFKVYLSGGMLSQDGLYFTRCVGPKGASFGGTTNSVAYIKWYYAPGSLGSGVQSVTITAAGTYTGTTPTVTFAAAPAGGVTATGVAILNGAGTAVIGVLITNPGSGYLTAPAVTFGAGGATGTAVLAAASATENEVANGTNLSASSVRQVWIGQ